MAGDGVERGSGVAGDLGQPGEQGIAVAHKAGQPDSTGLLLVPDGHRSALDLVVLEVPDGDAYPALRAKLPLTTRSIGDVENLKVARIVGIGVYEVDVTGDLGQPGEQGIPVAVAPASARRFTSAPECTCQHRGEPECHGAAGYGSYRISQEFASRLAPVRATRWTDGGAWHSNDCSKSEGRALSLMLRLNAGRLARLSGVRCAFQWLP